MIHDMRALTVAANCADAYSADCFGPVAWVQAAQMLCDMGYNDTDVESILRSKLTRWARDAFGEPSTYVAALYENVITLRRSGRLADRVELTNPI